MTADDKLPLDATSTDPARKSGESTTSERYCPRCERSYTHELTHCPHDDVRLVVFGAAADPLLGKTIRGAFTLRERIGRGGMGVVYAAWQHSVGRQVAVKVMSERIAADADAAKRFFREANLASRLSHPNIVTVHDFGQSEDHLLYMVMEFLHGVTLRDLVHDGPLDIGRTVSILRQMCDALEAAHDSDIVHRDLKPGNIMLLDKPGARDFVKVLDFGIAKSLTGDETTLTSSGMVLGTPAYAAPEVTLDGTVDARSDIYSLGIIVYQMLTGQRPFNADDARALIAMHATEPIPPMPATIPPALAALVERALEKAPADRFQSVAEFRATLDAAHTAPITMRRIANTPAALELGVAETTPLAVGDGAFAVTGEHTQVPRGRRLRVALLITLLVFGLGIGAGLMFRGDDTAPEHTTGAAVTTDAGAAAGPATVIDAAPPAAETGAMAKPSAGSDARTAAATVTLVIAAPRATIYVDGKRRGRGRVSMKAPRSDQPMAIRITRAGYRSWRGTLVPNEDRTLRPTLERIRRTSSSSSRRPAGESSPGGKPNKPPKDPDFLPP